MLGFFKRKSKNNDSVEESIKVVEDFNMKVTSLDETLYNIQTIIADITAHRKNNKNEI